VCLNEGGSAFNFVVGQPAPGGFLRDLRQWLRPAHEAFDDYLETLPSVADTSKLIDRAWLSQTQKFVAFPAPLMLPTGLICPASEGIAGIRAILDELSPAFSQAFCKHPYVLMFAHNAKTDPTHTSLRWLSRRWIQDALAESSVTPVWASPGDCDQCLDAERRLAYRLHHDFLSTTRISTTTVRKGYQRYVQRAHEAAYNAMSPLSGIPLELAGELYYIQPPSVKSWDKKLFLSYWVTAESVAPSTRQYLVQPIPNK
jgi:hypothetical protein